MPKNEFANSIGNESAKADFVNVGAVLTAMFLGKAVSEK